MQLYNLLFLYHNFSGPGGWGAANRLDYSYGDFQDTVRETPTGAGIAEQIITSEIQNKVLF